MPAKPSRQIDHHQAGRLDIRLELSWHSDGSEHLDSRFLSAVDPDRDRLPSALAEALSRFSLEPGARVEVPLQPGDLVPDRHPELVLPLDAGRFDGAVRGQGVMQPRLGRFYPIRRLKGNHNPPSDLTAFRIGELESGGMCADLNHPLSGQDLALAAEIEAIEPASASPAPSPRDIARELCGGGPGMQGRWRGLATDFFSDDPFSQFDPTDDALFYRQPRLVDHLDSTAIGGISALYGRLIPPGSRILDLMSSWHSHLPQTLEPASVVGLGMNGDELNRNPVLTGQVVQDLNSTPQLPFADESLNAVICTVSVEYLIEPLRVFRDLARVLAPGGIAIMTFSDRWFPPKVVRVWQLLHEFERPGLVLELFRHSGRFRDLQTLSLRGRPRPPTDPYADRLPHSDPVHAVWAYRD